MRASKFCIIFIAMVKIYLNAVGDRLRILMVSFLQDFDDLLTKSLTDAQLDTFRKIP